MRLQMKSLLRLQVKILMIAWALLFLLSHSVPERWNRFLFWAGFVFLWFGLLMVDKILDKVEKAGFDAEINVAGSEEDMVGEHERKSDLHRRAVQTKNKREG